MNIFIAKTPYHVLLAHAVNIFLHRTNHENDNPYCLIYSGNDMEAIKPIIASDYWEKICHYKLNGNAWNPTARKSVRNWMHATDLGEPGASIYISDDMNWKDQILQHYLHAKKIHLIEDGLGSYYLSQLTLTQTLFRNIVLRSFLGQCARHYGPVSQSHADKYFAMDANAFPWVENRKKVTIIRRYVEEHLKRIRSHVTIDPIPHKEADLFFLTQPFYESDLMSKQKDLYCHKQLAGHFKWASNVVIKKHPREHEEMFHDRVKTMGSAVPDATLYPIEDSIPAELLLANAARNSVVVSFVSTALVNLKRLRPELDIYFCPVRDVQGMSAIFIRLGIKQIQI